MFIPRNLLLLLFLCSSSLALKSNNHKFLGKIISRIDETVKNVESFFHHSKTSNGDDTPEDQTKLWAVLVAGSNGYYNYRHQVC